MKVVEEIEALKWNNLAYQLEPVGKPPQDTPLDEMLGLAVDIADQSGFFWLPRSLGGLTLQLFEESQSIQMYEVNNEDDGIYRRGNVIEWDEVPTLSLLRDAAARAFAKRDLPTRISFEILDYPDEESHMTAHMDMGSILSPTLLFVIGGERQPNFQVCRLPGLGDHIIPTGPGDVIAQSGAYWGKAMGLRHGVVRGPRRSISAFGI